MSDEASRGGHPARMVPARDRFVDVRGVRLHYLEWGESARPAILLLHGGSAHAHWWDFFAAGMVDRHRVLALDLRGHGDSTWSPDGEYEIDTHVGDVLALIEALGLASPVLAGHSFGGLVAMAAAEHIPERIRALIVIDTRLKVGERAARFMGALRRLPQPVYASLEDAVQRFRLLPAANDAAPEVLEHVAANAMRQLEDGTWTLKFDRRGIANTRPCDLSSALAAVRAPILVVRAAASELMSEADLAEFRAVAPHAEAVVIPDAHHHVMLDRPEALVAAVRGFLEPRNL